MRSLVFVAVVACWKLALLACGAPRPAHRYPVPAEVGALVVDEAAFAGFARKLRADAERDLRGDLPAKDRKDRLFVLALLDGIAGRWRDAVAHLDAIRALETDPKLRAITGVSIRIWAEAGGDPAAFGTALGKVYDALPLDLVRDELAMLRAMGQAFTPEVCRQLVNDSVKPAGGTVSIADAQTIAFQRYAVVRLAPVGTVIDEALAARGVGLPSAGGNPQPD